MASLKRWSELKIPQKLSKRLSNYCSQTRHESTQQNALGGLTKADKLETEGNIVMQWNFMAGSRIPSWSTSFSDNQKCVQYSHLQLGNIEVDTKYDDMDFLHQIGKNRFPTLEKCTWWGLYDGVKSEMSQLSQLKLLLAMLCVWSLERAQTLCSAATKMYEQNNKSEDTPDSDVYYTPKSNFNMGSSHQNVEVVHAKKSKVGSLSPTTEHVCPIMHVVDETTLHSKLSLNEVFTFQAPYPRLQPNASKFAEGLLNTRTHFIAVKRAFSTDAEILVDGEQLHAHQLRSPTRKQFLRSCSKGSNSTTGINRESYTRETINKMTTAIKRIPTIAEVKKSEQKQKQSELPRGDTFDTNVYFIGHKGLNTTAKEDQADLTGVAQTLHREVSKMSHEKEFLISEISELTGKVASLTQREIDLKNEIEVLNGQFQTLSNENRDMFKVKESVFNVVEELSIRRDALAKEEDILWQKLERLNKRIAEKYKRVNPYGEYNDALFSMESMLCSDSECADEWKTKAGMFLHKKICPGLEEVPSCTSESGKEAEESESNNKRKEVKAMIMEANKHRFRRCEEPTCKGNSRTTPDPSSEE